MGLLINSTTEKDIILCNSDVGLYDLGIYNIYARVQYTAYPNGKSIEACLTYYISKESYKVSTNKLLAVEIDTNFYFDINEDEEQTNLVVHNHLKQILDDLGYLTEIQL